MKPKTIAIIQARMGATRLPGKVLCDIAGQPMLVRVVERTRRASLLDGFIVATTTEVQDDALYELCRERGYPCFRGDQQDVLDRYYQSARQTGAEVVVRITADCPVIDPDLIDETTKLVTGRSSLITHHALRITHHASLDFAANRLPPPWGRTYPIGLDVEVCTFAALERAWKEATKPYQREHWMWKSAPSPRWNAPGKKRLSHTNANTSCRISMKAYHSSLVTRHSPLVTRHSPQALPHAAFT